MRFRRKSRETFRVFRFSILKSDFKKTLCPKFIFYSLQIVNYNKQYNFICRAKFILPCLIIDTFEIFSSKYQADEAFKVHQQFHKYRSSAPSFRFILGSNFKLYIIYLADKFVNKTRYDLLTTKFKLSRTIVIYIF